MRSNIVCWDKETLVKAKKDAREKKMAKVKEKKKAEAEVTKKKKRAKAEAAKEKKRIEAKAIIRKKIEDRVAKNVETSLQKEQTSKHKAALSNDSVAKKKQQKTEDIAKTESKLDPKASFDSKSDRKTSSNSKTDSKALSDSNPSLIERPCPIPSSN